jgi:nitroreductase
MRTAPSAVDWQNIDIYVTTPDGLFLYDALNNSLKVMSHEDVRSAAGNVQVQPFVKNVPVNLVYIADFAKAKGMGGQGGVMDTAEPWSWAGAGAIAENVYLFCASEGLASVVRAFAADKDVIQKTFKLRPEQHYLLAQSVGYFKTPPAAAPAAGKK